MMRSATLALALLPVLSFAAPNPEMYTVEVAGIQTAYELPPWSVSTETTFTREPEATPNVEGNGAPGIVEDLPEEGAQAPSPTETGTTIPVSLGGQETSVVLPSVETPGATPVVVPVIAAGEVEEVEEDVNSLVASVSDAAASISAEASAAVASVASSLGAEVTEAVSEVSSGVAAAATEIAEGYESVTSAVGSEVSSVVAAASSGANSVFVIVADDDAAESAATAAATAVVSAATSVVSAVVSAANSVENAVETGIGGVVVVAPGPVQTGLSTVTAYSTTLYGLYSQAQSAASNLVAGAPNATVTVAAPTGGVAVFTVPATGVFNPTATRPAIYTGAATPQRVQQGGMVGLMAGLAALFLA